MKTSLNFLIFMLVVLNYSCRNSESLKIDDVENDLLAAISNSIDNPVKYNIYQRMKYYNVPGVSIAVIDNDEIVWAKGYGVLETGTKRKVTTKSIFQIGSVGKIITALTTLSLVEKGILDLDKDVNSYLKSWKITENKYTKGKKITLRELLSHTAGISDDYSAPFHRGSAIPSLTEHLRNNNYAVIKEPGEGYFYTGAGYIIIEQIIEDVTGKSYKSIAEEEVLQPLGVKDTYFQILLSSNLMNIAALAHHNDGTLYLDKYPVYPCFAPGTCNWSTAVDMAKLFIELQKSYYGKSNKILTQTLTRIMMSNYSPAYGLGIKLISEGGNTFIGHSGDFYGFHACIYGYLKQGKGIVVLTNGDNGVLLYDEIIRSVAKVYHWPGCKQEIISDSDIDSLHYYKLCGCYFLPGKLDVMNIYKKGNRLYADVLGDTRSELIRVSSYKFYNRETDGFINFFPDSDSTVQNVEFRRIGVLLPGVLLSGFDLLYTDRFNEGKRIILDSREKYMSKSYFENIFNSIGYELMGSGKTLRAIKVFKLALSIYPEASNLYDSIGEAYMKNRQRDQAIKNYKKSLELDPKNMNAVEMLKKLGG